MRKERLLTIGLILATVILAILAVLTAYKIATRQPVAPTVPQKVPKAATPECKLQFSVNPPFLTSTPTPTGEITPTGSLTPTLTPSVTPTGILTPTSTLTPSLTPTSTSTVTPTVVPLLGCYRECESDDNCEGTLRCQTVSGVKRCVDLSCPGEKDCLCNKNCWEVCGQESECPEELTCHSIEGVYRCVNPNCDREQDCGCTVAQAPTVTPKPTGPIPTPVELPEAGISLPTIGAALGGVILAIVSLLLAL